MKAKQLIVYNVSKELIPQPLQKILEENSVKITDNLWEQLKMKEPVFQIKEWNLLSLRVDFNQNKNILKEISHISFGSLQQLYVIRNNIESIQQLPSIYMPKLNIISFSGNNISNINSLKKTYYKQLQTLFLYENNIQELKIFTEMCSTELARLVFEWFEDEREQGQDFKWINKLESKKFESLGISSDKRLKQVFVSQSIKKYSSLEFE